MNDFSTLTGLIQFIEKHYQNQRAFNFHQDGEWISVSTTDFVNNVYALTLGLNALGLKPNDGFGIVARPSPIWLMADFAALANRAVSVPIFPDISQTNLLFEINDAEVKFVFCDCEENLKILQDSNAQFQKIIIHGFKAQCENIADNIIHFDDLLKSGQAIYQQNPGLFDSLSAEIKEGDLATIIYTSGSTGVPKGVEITHKNLVSQIKAINQCFALDYNSDVALSFLPLAHIFERTVINFYISKGISIYFADDVKNVGNLLREIKPTLITVVPRMLEKVFSKMQNGVNEAGFLKKCIGNIAFNFAAKHTAPTPLIRGEIKPSVRDLPHLIREAGGALKYKLFNLLVYKKLRASLGGNLKMMICGGAPLAENLEKFFCGVGINLYVGYGTTESSPVIAVNYKDYHKIGTVGKALPGVQTKISRDGELWAKGDNIMRGYHKNPEKTDEVISEGWLKTGDLATIDDQGFIKIIGRKKEMFKTAGGKYVSPVPIEQSLLGNWQLISAACIIAEGKKFVSCLLFPDFDILPRYKQKAKLENLSDEEFLNSDFIKSRTDKLITLVNKNLNHWEQIQKYYLVKETISIKSGELTPSMKLKRNFVEEKYKDVIEEFYTE
jgi:long-chain acyl-CoA synthetase